MCMYVPMCVAPHTPHTVANLLVAVIYQHPFIAGALQRCTQNLRAGDVTACPTVQCEKGAVYNGYYTKLSPALRLNPIRLLPRDFPKGKFIFMISCPAFFCWPCNDGRYQTASSVALSEKNSVPSLREG